MEDIVAIKVKDWRGRRHYFLTWGRAFDVVDPEPLLSAVQSHLRSFGIRRTRSVSVCDSLQEAARECYFYEALFAMSRRGIPFGGAYRKWKAAQKKQILQGREIYYLGKRPNKTS